MMREKTKEKIQAIKTLIDKGTPIAEACKQVQLSPMTYRKGISKVKRTRRKRVPHINITDLPQAAPQQPLFLIYGSPAMLAEFTRTLQ